jgi:hypothetical protein
MLSHRLQDFGCRNIEPIRLSVEELMTNPGLPQQLGRLFPADLRSSSDRHCMGRGAPSKRE